jgi:hypothetical protein
MSKPTREEVEWCKQGVIDHAAGVITDVSIQEIWDLIDALFDENERLKAENNQYQHDVIEQDRLLAEKIEITWELQQKLERLDWDGQKIGEPQRLDEKELLNNFDRAESWRVQLATENEQLKQELQELNDVACDACAANHHEMKRQAAVVEAARELVDANRVKLQHGRASQKLVNLEKALRFLG